MHFKELVVCLFFIASCIPVFGQGIEFEHGTWKEAMELAQTQQKIIFVDGYAVWCGPCKRLSKNVFPRKDVGDYFNTNFINVKMDMERGEGPTFRKKYPLSAFPTLYFIAPDGELIQSTRGAPRTPEALLQLAHQAIEKYDPAATFMRKYEDGDRSYENTYNLIRALNKRGKPSLKYTNEFLRTQDNLETEDNLRFIFEGMTQLDSRVYDEFLEREKEISKLFPKDEIEVKIYKAAMQTVENAAEYNFPQLLKEAQEKFSKQYPRESKAFETQSTVRYALLTGDADMLVKAFDDKYFSNAEQKALINSVLDVFGDNEQVIGSAEKWAKDVASDEESAGSYYLLAMTQVKQARTKQAVKSLERCIELTDPDSDEIKIYREHLQKLNENG